MAVGASLAALSTTVSPSSSPKRCRVPAETARAESGERCGEVEILKIALTWRNEEQHSLLSTRMRVHCREMRQISCADEMRVVYSSTGEPEPLPEPLLP